MVFGPTWQFNRPSALAHWNIVGTSKGSGDYLSSGPRHGVPTMKAPHRRRPHPGRVRIRSLPARSCALRLRLTRKFGGMAEARDLYRTAISSLTSVAIGCLVRVRSITLVPAAPPRAIGTTGVFRNEFRKIHRPRPRFHPIGAVAGAARRPPAIRARASAQGAARRPRGIGRRAHRPLRRSTRARRWPPSKRRSPSARRSRAAAPASSISRRRWRAYSTPRRRWPRRPATAS